MNILILSALLVGGAPPPAAAPTHPPPPRALRALDPPGIGWCKQQTNFVNLGEVMFLENRSLVNSGPEGRFLVRLSRQDVVMETVSEPQNKLMYVNNVREGITNGSELDIELKLGLLKGKLIVYWRETYLHRMYRQGVFNIVGKRLESACEGEGGVEYSH